MKATLIFLVLFGLLLVNANVQAQDDDALAEFARKAQDPLGDIKALMTDNTIAFDGGPNDDTSYSFQLQPVYSLDTTGNWNMLLRGIVPIAGLEPGVVAPPIGPEPRPPAGSTWGISDSIVQMFFSPKSDSAWKWGMGPQVSLDTSSSERVAGAGWGYGAAGVIFGGVGNFALGLVGMYHWGEDDFEVGTIQPILLYNFPNAPGYYLGYNNSLTYNPEAESGNKWQVPLGLTVGRTLLLGSGDGLDLSLGAYDLAKSPDGGHAWQLKFGISYFFN
jgi:hypothetical protein